jgi:Tfp pilus assembly protein PilF
LFTLATTYFRQGNFTAAVPLLEELVQIRRYADAWHALSLCREELGDVSAATAASVQAAGISPFRPDFQDRLAYLYESGDRPELAARHRERARLVQKLAGPR